MDTRHAVSGEAGEVPLCPTIALVVTHRPLSTKKLLATSLMAHSHTSASSSNFQLIINNALKAYEKRTKNDLLAHPLASQLQVCNSPGDILAILQQQVGGSDQSRNGDDRWTKWLDPTVNVLFAFSATLGAGVGLVCSRICAYMRPALSHLFGSYSHPRVQYSPGSACSFQYVFSVNLTCVIELYMLSGG